VGGKVTAQVNIAATIIEAARFSWRKRRRWEVG
jgi:hypothetical protein